MTEDDEDIQFLTMVKSSAPPTLPSPPSVETFVPPPNTKVVRMVPGPVMRPNGPKLMSAEAIRQRMEQDRQEVIRKSIECQRMLIPGAEDVSSLNDMMILKDEVIHYICLQIDPEQGFPPLPRFFHFSLFYITTKAKHFGRRPVYAHHLIDLIKWRLRQMFPTCRGDFMYGIWAEMEKFLQRFADANRHKNMLLIREAQDNFELLLGETYQFISKFHQKFKKPPPSMKFFLHFCLFFRSLGYKKPDNKNLDEGIVYRMQKNLPTIPADFFNFLHHQMNSFCAHEMPRS